MAGHTEHTGVSSSWPHGDTAAFLKPVPRVNRAALHSRFFILHFLPGPGARILTNTNQAYARKKAEEPVFLCNPKNCYPSASNLHDHRSPYQALRLLDSGKALPDSKGHTALSIQCLTSQNGKTGFKRHGLCCRARSPCLDEREMTMINCYKDVGLCLHSMINTHKSVFI